jgi:hypothetical protein
MPHSWKKRVQRIKQNAQNAENARKNAIEAIQIEHDAKKAESRSVPRDDIEDDGENDYVSENNFERMTLAEAQKHLGFVEIQTRLLQLARESCKCDICKSTASPMKAGYFCDGKSFGLPRPMCEPCRRENARKAGELGPRTSRDGKIVKLEVGDDLRPNLEIFNK